MLHLFKEMFRRHFFRVRETYKIFGLINQKYDKNFEAKFLLIWTIGKLDETWHGLLNSYLEFHWTCWYNVSNIR